MTPQETHDLRHQMPYLAKGNVSGVVILVTAVSDHAQDQELTGEVVEQGNSYRKVGIVSHTWAARAFTYYSAHRLTTHKSLRVGDLA